MNAVFLPAFVAICAALGISGLVACEPTGGPQGPRTINVAPGQKMFVNGEPAMTEKEWRKLDNAKTLAAIQSKPARLPAFFALCAKLGVPDAECNDFTLNGGNQTDKTLWYTSTSSTPDNLSLDSSCYKPVAIAHYLIYDGSRGTTYACLAPPENDKITSDELAAIAHYVDRVNSLVTKTLRDHEMALEVKRMAHVLAEKP